MTETAKWNSTIYDVAALAGVSAKTVSRVMNDSPNVTDATREKVTTAINELQYERNPLATSLRRGRGDAVAIVVGPLTDPFFASLASGIQHVAKERGSVPILITGTEADPARERSLVESMVRRQVSGIVLVPIGPDQSYIASLPPEVPVVFADRRGGLVERDTVIVDDEAAAFEATEHLIRAGHRRIALVGDLDKVSSAGARERGYRDALVAAGIDVDHALIAHCPSPESVVQAAHELLALAEPPTAIFSSNAQASLALVPYLHEADRTEIAIVCFGDFPMASSLKPGITVIDQDPVEMGEAAARMLFARLDGTADASAQTLVLPTRLIARGSGELPPQA